MKFSKTRLMLPVLALLLVPQTYAQSNNAISSSNALFEKYHPAAPYPLKPVDNPTVPAGANCPIPQLSLPVLPADTKPWTGTNVNNDPRNFQIAIVTDRNGGMRPGIFKDAVAKLNLLQPEFVMSIGDFIHGYSEDEKAIKGWWDDFENVLSKLQMPFFKVPGNHDLTNPVETAEWNRRIGPTYYHFTYGNVLFLCLNSEDGKQNNISEEQVDYFRKVLQENQDVRWTLVFLHKPLWSNYYKNLSEDNPDDLKRMKETRWYDIEQLLQGRNYTVFAGHVHAYTQYIRHGQKYYSLATTGGGSSLRGAKTYGRFDHVVWLTMTDKGPIIANLALDGIFPEDLRVETETYLLHDAERKAVHAEVTITDPLPFTSGTLTIDLANPATRPLVLKLTPPEGALKFDPPTMKVTLAPGEKKQVSFALNGTDVKSEKDLTGLDLEWTGTYEIEGRSDLKFDERTALRFDAKGIVKPATQAVAIDGNLQEWVNLMSRPQRFLQIEGSKHAWGGTDDVSFKYGLQHDAQNVYLAIAVNDDDLLTTTVKGHPIVDALKVSILPEGADEDSKNAIRILARPAEQGNGLIKSAATGVNAVCVTTGDGYQLEAAIPASLLSKSGANWNSFRMNVQINDDDDKPDSRRSKQWWRPEWDSGASYPQSGTFIRGK